MQAYLDLVRHVLEHGEPRTDRTGTGTLSVFGIQNRYDLRDGFPLLTTKKVLFSAVVRELLWFLKGSTNIYDNLTQHTPIWDAWADSQGELGPIYGRQWRQWGKEGIDQIQQVVDTIRKDPDSRRLIVSAWNVSDLQKMALPPCHAFFQFYVCNREIDCQLYQRSADLALGVPFNIASYALLLTLIAQECELRPRYLIHTFGDAHLYLNHLDGIKEQLRRAPLPPPSIKVAKKPLFDIEYDDIVLSDYQHHPFIKFQVAV
ncbi:MAG: thymidylate synthase [Myxococcales bacterium]|nr:thymidylate synthase [Myxococcales bacterium]MCB9708845.1 thymidylate synthase [Myxococcales bacterium]